MVRTVKPTTAPTTLFDSSFHPLLITLPSTAPGRSIFALHRPSASASLSSSPKVLLLHGFPQTHTLFYLLAPLLPKTWDILIPDLPGYGRSTLPPDSSKRELAKDLLEATDEVWGKGTKVFVVGHDRGARVAYRAAADGDERVKAVGLLDVVPVINMWERMAHYSGPDPSSSVIATATAPTLNPEAFGAHHWILLALDPPIPELLFNSSNVPGYLRQLIHNWSGTKIKSSSDNAGAGYDPAALASWVASFSDSPAGNELRGDFTVEDRVKGFLQDYRAGARADVVHDREFLAKDKEDRIKVNTLIIASGEYLASRYDVEGVWKEWFSQEGLLELSVFEDGVGHFEPVEAPEKTADVLSEWVERVWKS